MKILIIGGTKFLGRHLVDAAVKGGHAVSLFNRGKLSDMPPAGTEFIQGERHSDLDRLAGRTWDAVIDTCGYLPQSVSASSKALASRAGRYVFISSISAYADFSKPNYDETAETATLSPEKLKAAGEIDLRADITAPVLGEMYGGLKALCEAAAEKEMPGRTAVIRPGLIVGPYDWTDRFTYWVMRVDKDGEVLAPGEPGRFVQLIDARDLSEWIIELIKQGSAGVFNATGKPFDMTMGQMLETVREVTGSQASFTWVDENFLADESVQAWNEMPLYLPESDEDSKGFLSANVNRALQTGLKFRPLANTVRDTLEWRRGQTFEMRAGITGEREFELLAKWREHSR